MKNGSEKQIAWASKIQSELIAHHNTIAAQFPMYAVPLAIINAELAQIDNAAWWIAHRDIGLRMPRDDGYGPFIINVRDFCFQFKGLHAEQVKNTAIVDACNDINRIFSELDDN